MLVSFFWGGGSFLNSCVTLRYWKLRMWGGEVCAYFSVNLRAFQRNLLPSTTRMQVVDYSETSAHFSKGTGRHDSHDDNFHHHHHISVMELGHLLTRSSLTYPEVSSKVCHNSFCQLENSVSLPWVIYYEAFYLHVVSSFSCTPVICPKLMLF